MLTSVPVRRQDCIAALLQHGVPAGDDAASVLRGKGAIGRSALQLFERLVAARDAEEAIASARAKWDANPNKWVDAVLRLSAGGYVRLFGRCFCWRAWVCPCVNG